MNVSPIRTGSSPPWLLASCWSSALASAPRATSAPSRAVISAASDGANTLQEISSAEHQAGRHRTPFARAPGSGYTRSERRKLQDLAAGCELGRRRRGCRLRDCHESLRHRLIEHRGERPRDLGPQRAMLLDTASQRRIALHGGRDQRLLCLIELAVGVRHESFVVVVHGGSPISSSERAAASAVRPRARRLVRVPMGISSTAAASLYDIPSTSTSAMASR